ncbi:uncharacterized protein [Ptychodera flava]|uniref:uncharacterized protein isoform X2 n=1 Tax=Ptychodera flava TaxID=63121 RepID=UPI00396A61E1
MFYPSESGTFTYSNSSSERSSGVSRTDRGPVFRLPLPPVTEFGLSGGGPAKPPARSVKKSNSSFSNISAPPIVQNGRQREGREGRGGRGHRATRSNNSLRKENGVDKNDLFRTTNSAPAAGAAKETTTVHRKPPPGPLPKLNNLVATDAHGVTSATQSVRDHSSRHWASSWADAYSRNAASLPRSDTKISTHSRTTQATLDTDGGRSEQRTPRYVSKPVQKRPKRPVIITKKSIYQVQAVTAVYGNRTFKKQRHARILKQLEEIELKDAVEHNQKLVEKEKSVIESKKKQKAALKRLRTRFDEEQVQRFKTQYVTWKSVEHERRGRGPERYGLPETIDDDELTKLVSKKQRKGSQRKFRQPHSREQNIKRFEKLLNPKLALIQKESLRFRAMCF